MSEERRAVVAAVEAAAAALDDVERVDLPDGPELRRAGRPFARVLDVAIGYRLAGRVASAALATPGVARSPSGPDWIVFTPESADQYAMDRALAWLELAWRRASPSGSADSTGDRTAGP